MRQMATWSPYIRPGEAKDSLTVRGNGVLPDGQAGVVLSVNGVEVQLIGWTSD